MKKQKSLQKISEAPLHTQALFKAALESRKHAYAPYSKCHVGAAIRTASGIVFTGCNVENASYGGSNCAERVAIQKSVSEGETQIVAVCVVTDSEEPWPPCGFCRQVIGEFGVKVSLYWANIHGLYHQSTLEEMLPYSFTKNELENTKGQSG